MSKSNAEQPVAASSSPEPMEEKKRKRKEDDIPEDEKLEIDVSLPEPPSKKAKRAEKKKKSSKSKKASAPTTDDAKVDGVDNAKPDTEVTDKPDAPAAAQPTRTEYGIWIGNLPWSATKDTLRQFLKDEGKVWEREIVRLHMPAPMVDKNDTRASKPQNKGFAYVDFTTQEVLDRVLPLSEKLLVGRRVLIKNAKSFEGRPDKPASSKVDGNDAAGRTGKKEPAKRIFVGNLSFDVTQEDLSEHFGQAGEIEDIHMATFEDSGKCKGFAWVRFKEIEGAEAAVRGFVYKKADGDTDEGESDEDDDEDQAAKGKKKPTTKRHKQHINRLQGRELRREFAEDAQTRYKKRYGKNTTSTDPPRDRRDPSATGAGAAQEGGFDGSERTRGFGAGEGKKRPDKDQRRDERRKRHERIDARTVAPGQALANAPRSSGAIVAGAGKKIAFD